MKECLGTFFCETNKKAIKAKRYNRPFFKMLENAAPLKHMLALDHPDSSPLQKSCDANIKIHEGGNQD